MAEQDREMFLKIKNLAIAAPDQGTAGSFAS
jgi:hypothetical protein